METYFFETILCQEMNSIRFEHFCCDLYSAVSGSTVVPTSKSYDLGRDGRQVGAGKATEVYLAATLNKNIDYKVALDIDRLKETTKVKTLVYCCSMSLTEDAFEKIKEEIKRKFSYDVYVEPLGATQLASLAEKHIDVFNKYYKDDLTCILKLKEKAGTSGEAAEQKGLRLALLSFACEDAAALRTNLSKHLVLELLSDRSSLQVSDISKSISVALGLPKPINELYIRKTLEKLLGDDLVVESNKKWSITEKGKTQVDPITPEAFDNLLEGRSILFNGIYQLTGYKLSPEAFNQVWNIFQEYIAHLFYTNGLHTVQLINALLNNQAASDDKVEFNQIIEELSGKIAAFFSDQEQADSIKQAVLDIFSERTGDAFQWLASICSAFVSLCSLGLEGTSAEQIMNTLKKTKLVIDTDILISLLCDKEPQHDPVVELLKHWKGMGGEVYVHESVLKEAAYHAWISEKDYNEVSQNLADIATEEEADRYIQNAFVRTFKFVAGKNYGYRAWNSYISQFRGDSDYDFSKILEICSEEYGVLILKNADAYKYKDFTEDVKRFIVSSRLSMRKGLPVSQDERRRIEGKSENDAQLLGSILQFRFNEKSKGSGDTLSLVSSSSLFLEADTHYRKTLGAPEAVLTLPAVSYLMALLPGTQYSIGSLKTMLFNFGRRIRLRPEERIAMRILKASSEYDLPFAKRAPLKRNLRDALMKEARNNGTEFNKEYEEFIKEPTSEEQVKKAAHIIVEAVEKIASFEKKSERKLYDAMQEQKRLKSENEALREKLRKLSKK